MKERKLVFLTAVTGEAAWVLPELLDRCGIICYRRDESGRFHASEEAGEGDLYVWELQLRQAQRCMEMAGCSSPEFELDEAEGVIKEPETGSGAWRVFLVLLALTVLGIVAGIVTRFVL